MEKRYKLKCKILKIPHRSNAIIDDEEHKILDDTYSLYGFSNFYDDGDIDLKAEDFSSTQSMSLVSRTPLNSTVFEDTKWVFTIKHVCLLSVVFSFCCGLLLGAHVPGWKPPSIEDKPQDTNKITDGIFWNEAVETKLPTSFNDLDHSEWGSRIRGNAAVQLEPGCGRMQNRLVKLADGGAACARYRQSTEQVQGDLFSYWLARALRLHNVPPTVPALVHFDHELWRAAAQDAAVAGWRAGSPVALTQFVPGLEPAGIPQRLRLSSGRINTITISDATPDELVELAQWSDLIVFDYLTANLDRVVNNLYNARWNPNMMEAPTHNLARINTTGALMFLDNESGLLHGYRLLRKYDSYHVSLLKKVCVFRRSTVEAVKKLHASRAAGVHLDNMWSAATAATPAPAALRDALPALPIRSARLLQQRLAKLVSHFDACLSHIEPKMSAGVTASPCHILVVFNTLFNLLLLLY